MFRVKEVEISTSERHSDSMATLPIPDMSMSSTQPDTALPAAPGPKNGNLRATALQGGAYLAVREIIGIAVRAGGLVVVTRIIGPADYGIYTAAAVFAAVIVTMTQMGMEVYLIRQTNEPTRDLYDQVFTFMLVVSVAVAAVAAGLGLAVAKTIPSTASADHLFIALMLSVPLNVLWAPAQAKIERAFDYRRMAILELGGDIVLYATAIPLAEVGAGAWSLTVAFIVWQASLFVGSLWLARMRPRIRWSNAVARDLLAHGIPYSSNGLVGTLKGMVNPVVVGAFFGSAGVGYVALAIRLVDTMGFAQRATWRLGMVALSKVRDDLDRLRRGVQEGLLLQLLATAAPLVVLGVLAGWIIPVGFGRTWLPVIPVLALLSTSRVITAPLTVEFALLFSHGRNTQMTLGTAANTALTFGVAYALVPWIGIRGYGWAVLIASIAWVYVHRKALECVTFSYGVCWALMVAVVPALFFAVARWPYDFLTLAPLLIIVAYAPLRRRIGSYLELAASMVVPSWRAGRHRIVRSTTESDAASPRRTEIP